MRLALIISSAICLPAGANPVPRPVLTNAYIASERLVVTISPAEARFAGTFTFKVPGEFPKWKRLPPAAGITIPVWFPETNEENPNVATFWRALRRGGALRPFYLTSRDLTPGLSDVYNEAIGLKASIGKTTVEIMGFDTTPPEMDTPDRKSYGLYWWREVQEQGFSILRFQVPLFPQAFTKAEPVRISYRQPLLHVDGKRRFFYAPVLTNLPAGVISSDTNVYSITLEAAPECELAITYGSQHFNVGGGGSLTLGPKHFQAIRATVTPRHNPQGGANGRQRLSFETNRTSAETVSRRSP